MVTDDKSIGRRLFGEEGHRAHGEAITALHRFAQLTDCPIGGDVIDWYAKQTSRWQAECSREYQNHKPAALSPETDR